MAKAKTRMGRPSIFFPKNEDKRMNGYMTNLGADKFEQHRSALAALYQDITGVALKATSISNGDVTEYLARGAANTRAYIQRTHGRSA